MVFEISKELYVWFEPLNLFDRGIIVIYYGKMKYVRILGLRVYAEFLRCIPLFKFESIC